MTTIKTQFCAKCGEEYVGAEVFCPKDGTRLVTASQMPSAEEMVVVDDPLIGTIIQGRYRVIGRLGEGGMGVVYIAEHVEIEKKVALKVLREDFSKRPEVVERFRQEARSASKIGDPHIVDVTDFGQLDDGGVFFVMEYLKGQGLSDIMDSEPVSLARSAPIIRQIARALKAAHKKGIVHRDLKPENIFLVEREDNKDFVKVLDFGIAKISDRDSEGKRLTKTGMIFGTPEYMSPEQAAGKALDHRVDVYALGCIMFELFTGRVPFDGETFMAVLTQHMFEPVPQIELVNPQTDVPESVRSVVYKAMAKNPDDRYADMAALESDLERSVMDTGFRIDSSGQTSDAELASAALRATLSQNSNGQTVDLEISGSPSRIGTIPRRSLSKVLPLGIGVLVLGGLGVLYGLGVLDSVVGQSTPSSSTKEVASVVNPVSNVEPTDPGAGGSKDSAEPIDTGSGDLAVAVGLDGGSERSMDFTSGQDASATQPEEASPKIDSDQPIQTTVQVQIQSEPMGAIISVEGLGQVCSKTPCDVTLEEGKPVEISAKKGRKKTSLVFTPSEQNKDLLLTLASGTKGKKTGRSGARKNKNPVSRGSRTDPKTELKVPTIFLND